MERFFEVASGSSQARRTMKPVMGASSELSHPVLDEVVEAVREALRRAGADLGQEAEADLRALLVRRLGGASLYFPRLTRAAVLRRRRAVLDLAERGLPARLIARRLGLSAPHVLRILRQGRASRRPQTP